MSGKYLLPLFLLATTCLGQTLQKVMEEDLKSAEGNLITPLPTPTKVIIHYSGRTYKGRVPSTEITPAPYPTPSKNLEEANREKAELNAKYEQQVTDFVRLSIETDKRWWNQTWEYRFESSIKAHEVERMGDQGWEFCGMITEPSVPGGPVTIGGKVYPYSLDGRLHQLYVFKRPKVKK